jgi:hypothetical protein
MGKNSRREYFRAIYKRYRRAGLAEKGQILDEFCRVCRYNRKYAIAKLNGPALEMLRQKQKPRKPKYDSKVIRILISVWKASGYLCSIRLKAALPIWLPWIHKRFLIDSATEEKLLKISARQIDRRLQCEKKNVKKSIYGRTKPGSLLKHQIPIKTDHWSVSVPGFTEVDLVSHSGNSASGEFIYSLNQTDILTGWVETRAVIGKSEHNVVSALEDIHKTLPFSLKGVDSDNGSEFINDHLYRYCKRNQIQFTRGRPYKKDDNAHIEQKNWTHVRKLLGWYRYDTLAAAAAINALYCNELRWMMNLFCPSMKLHKKTRIGSKIKKLYDQPKTPLDRLIHSGKGNPKEILKLLQLRKNLDPFKVSEKIEKKIEEIISLRSHFQLRKGMVSPLRIIKNINPMNQRNRYAHLKDDLRKKTTANNNFGSGPGGDAPPRTPPPKGLDS